MIWLFDHKQGGPTRILRGHGQVNQSPAIISGVTNIQEIYSIAFHPLHPHILASACADRTIRIWNIYGTDVQLEEGDIEPLSENFAQGDADEGSYLVAVLAGDKAGHKAGVTALVRHLNLHRPRPPFPSMSYSSTFRTPFPSMSYHIRKTG